MSYRTVDAPFIFVTTVVCFCSEQSALGGRGEQIIALIYHAFLNLVCLRGLTNTCVPVLAVLRSTKLMAPHRTVRRANVWNARPEYMGALVDSIYFTRVKPAISLPTRPQPATARRRGAVPVFPGGWHLSSPPSLTGCLLHPESPPGRPSVPLAQPTRWPCNDDLEALSSPLLGASAWPIRSKHR